MKQVFFAAAFLLLTGVAPDAKAGKASACPVDLRCEYRENPRGIDITAPRLSWRLEAGDKKTRGIRQTAYHVLAASSEKNLKKDRGDLWDSGKVSSDQSIHVPYSGVPLKSTAGCFWKVRIWDQAGNESSWSETASWTMGLLEASDWQAQWIGYDAAYQLSDEENKDNAVFNIQGLKWVRFPEKQADRGKCNISLRRKFDLPADRKVRCAIAVLYAFNFCEASVNGKPIGMAAHWEKTARLDATSAVQQGTNVMTVSLTHGDAIMPAVVGKLVVQFEAGEDFIVPLDASWKVSQGTSDGWEKLSYDDTAWNAAEQFDGMPWRGPPALGDIPRIPAPYFRKDFAIGKKVERATVYVSALGVYELHLNGERVGNDVLAPGWTDFRKRVHYQTYDVTERIKSGNNTIGAILGDGWYAGLLAHLARRNIYGGRPRLLVQLMVELADGSKQVVTSDGTWKAVYGPIRHADLLLGCEYDAQRAMPGWDRYGFDDSSWQNAIAGGGPTGRSGIADVSASLKSAVRDGKLSIKVENDILGGDPAPHVVKSLYIRYQVDGKETEKTAGEHEDVLIGEAGKELTIVKAEYGRSDSRAGGFRIEASVVEPSRPMEELNAVGLTEPKPGCWTFDLGQNMVGWVRLKVRDSQGQRITVRHAEMINPDGTVYTSSLRSCPATDYFILAGGGAETFEPYFTFHGFRYVEVQGLTVRPGVDDLKGIVVHTPMRRTGSFECSHKLLNQLYSNIVWGHRGNYLEIPTDCPQRDERMGWTGDTQFFVPTAAYNFDVAPFFTRWLTTMCEDSQFPDGRFPHVVPDIMGGGGATAWGDAALICTYNIYRAYADTRIVERHFGAMERYMNWLATRTTNGIASVGGFGDWLNLGGGADGKAIDTAYYAYLAGIMSEMALAIGRTSDAERYTKLFETEKTAFIREYLQADGSLKNCSQTGYALAFSMGLIPTERREAVVEKFISEIKRFDWHLATGFIGTPRLLPALNIAGRNDVAYKLLLQETYPSWLFPVKNGATTMWERWNGWTPDKGFGDITMNSFNHYAFGAVGEYLYGGVGGISAINPGYKTILVKPEIGEGITWAKTGFDSIHGRIESNWRIEDGRVVLDIVVPPNTSALVLVPAKDAAQVMESGKAAGSVTGVKFVEQKDVRAVFEVQSGSYEFTMPVI